MQEVSYWGASGSSIRYYRNLQKLHRTWKKIDEKSFQRAFKGLLGSDLVTAEKLKNDSVRLVLTEEGKKRAVASFMFGRAITFKKPKRWDKLWRVVIFDVPEEHRYFRDIFRSHISTIGFIPLQKSAFIYPYPCEKELMDLVVLYGVQEFVRIMTVHSIDNEKDLRKYFDV